MQVKISIFAGVLQKMCKNLKIIYVITKLFPFTFVNFVLFTMIYDQISLAKSLKFTGPLRRVLTIYCKLTYR